MITIKATQKAQKKVQLTFMSKSSKFAKPDDPKASVFGPCEGRGGAGLGGGCLAFLGGNAGDGDSGAGAEPLGGAWRFAKGSLPKSSLPVCGRKYKKSLIY